MNFSFSLCSWNTQRPIVFRKWNKVTYIGYLCTRKFSTDYSQTFCEGDIFSISKRGNTCGYLASKCPKKNKLQYIQFQTPGSVYEATVPLPRLPTIFAFPYLFIPLAVAPLSARWNFQGVSQTLFLPWSFCRFAHLVVRPSNITIATALDATELDGIASHSANTHYHH